MDLSMDIGLLAIGVLAAVAIVFAVVLQRIGEVRFGLEWVVTAVVAFLAGFVASEWIMAFRTIEPVWDGMALVPAIAAALVGGLIADAIVRFTTHGSYVHHAPAA